ncbi:MAG: anion permease [Chlamydiota bacterium]|jgi:DASS family divalent anion:Na+ symporter
MEIALKNKQIYFFLLSIFIGVMVWILPVPQGVDIQAWHLLAIFIATILGVILKPLPMGAMALIGLSASIVTNTLTFEQAFSGFSNNVVWLVVFAFFIARGFIVTGLGKRVAYFFVSILGKSTLGLSYGILATDLILAPAIPSLTARIGGILYPIVKGLAESFGSEPNSESSRKIGAFLIQTAFQGSVITAAMFLTSMAANPLIAELAGVQGASISWGTWALGSIVPGLVSLCVVPLILFKIYPPTLKTSEQAKALSKKQLKNLGKMKSNEWIMAATFILLICLWILGPHLGINAATVALIGLSFLLITKVLTWSDLLNEKGAWDTLIWFATLVTLAGFLNKFGLTTWFSNWVVQYVSGFNWILGFLILSLIYFFSHYFFASSLAHVGAMYAPFLIVAIALGAPPLVAALVLGYMSSLFGNLTQYSCGPAPILFGSGYVSVGAWWRLGFIMSIVNLIIWLGLGGVWWKVIGFW